MNTEITEYNKVRGWIFYDANCNLCTAMARRFQPLLAGRRFELLPLQIAAHSLKAGHQTAGLAVRLQMSDPQLMEEMRVLRPDGRCFGGADALLEIARDFWWAWPLRQLGRIWLIRRFLHVVYRWVARNRSCLGGSCEVKNHQDLPIVVARLVRWGRWRTGRSALPGLRIASKSAECGNDPSPPLFIGRVRDLGLSILPLVALPMMALGLKAHVAAWIFMWVMAFALYFGCKWLTYRQAICRGLRPRPARAVAYLLAWPGMDGTSFLDARANPVKPSMTEWLFAVAKMGAGVILLWIIARLLLPGHPVSAGWTGMIGVVFILHFGLFHLLSLFWRQAGITATPVMQNPILATSLAEFWGRRWNTAFNELAFQFTFRPLRRITTPSIATLLVFGLSGLIHEMVISVPAGGGYGLPALYFLIQGCAVVIERSGFGRTVGLGRGLYGWLFTLFITVAPVFMLFHRTFITQVILPMLNAIGAT